MKKYNPPVFVVFLCLLLLSCNQRGRKQQKEEIRSITDMAGRKVEIPTKIRTVFMDRHSVQLVYAFDAVEPVNRVFNYNDSEKKYLKESFYDGKPYVISDNVEEIINLKPDIILYSRLLTPNEIESVNRLQETTGIPVVLMDVDFMAYKEIIHFLGEVFDMPSKAKELTGFIEMYVDSIPAKAQQIAKEELKHVYYAEGMKGLNTDASGSIHSLLIDLAGGVNVAKTDILLGRGMTEVSLEQVYSWNPDVILVWSGNFDSMDSYRYIKTSTPWSKLPAVRQDKVYQVPWKPFGWIDRPPGVNRVIGIVWLANLLYPDKYNFDILAITKEYFSLFHHYEMTDEEALDIINPQPAL